LFLGQEPDQDGFLGRPYTVRQYVASIENQNYQAPSDGRCVSPATCRLVGGRPLASFIGDGEPDSGTVPPPPPVLSSTGAIPRPSQRADPVPDPVVTSPPASSRSRAVSGAGSVVDPAHLMEQGAASLELQQAAARPHRAAPPPPPARTTPLWQGEPNARAAPAIRQRLEEIRRHIDLDLAEAEGLMQVLKS
jgi:pyruvate/2-oxoglutarate dehydrogenase complex dihydrolipoamide acyltransferase (E2) component